MAFRVTDFIASLNKTGTAKMSNFEVLITPPRGFYQAIEGVLPQAVLDTFRSTSLENLSLRCEMVVFPGRRIETSDRKFHGPMRRLGYDAIYGDVNISVLLSEDFQEKLFFEAWQDLCLGRARRKQESTGESNILNMFYLGYYDDYVATMTIKQFDDTGKTTFEKILLEAYPIDIGPLSASWAQGNEIHRLPVTFTYRYYQDVK